MARDLRSHRRMSRQPLLVWAIATVVGPGCGDRATDAEPDAGSVDAGAADAGPLSITLRFERVEGGQDFDVFATVVDGAGQPLADQAIELAVDRGELESVED